ncbi:MAG: hypothetical protein E2O39_17390 [Planctomycetota bacterium]|nr:MAG: hypothetical protein E2O39_17390 [Planctomycetota bacterium]
MLIRLALTGAALASLAGPVSSQEILDELIAVHPDSVPGAMVSDPDGRYLFVAEGGALAALHVRANPQVFAVRSKRPIGATGVKPVRMILDPEADLALDDAPGFEDVLYIAGGRSGLWAVRADLRPGGADFVAVRVDDSTDLEPATQDSRRWCTDVDVMTVGGVRYLLALFAARSDSHLRVYCLDDVRGIAAAGTELGSELRPLYDVPLLAHPAAQTVPALAASEALAMAMDVDGGYAGTIQAGAEQAAVFVAMGSHGLVRVAFRVANFPARPCGLPWAVTPAPPAVRWGPVYGDGTWANTSSNPAFRRSWYGNFTYDVGNPDWNRTDPPRVLDVAVQNFGGG